MRKSKKFKKASGQKKKRSHVALASIKVVGIGGGGGNAAERMSRDFIRGVEFIAINTDHQDLDHCGVPNKIYIGRSLTRGLGTGMNPDLGRQAVEENRSEIAEALHGADMVFIAAGFGGGTGTGGAPIVAEVAKQAGALTIAVVTKPFAFEGSQRERIAQEGLVKLKDKVDALIVVPNDRIFNVISKDTPILKAFDAIDDVLRGALKGIVEIIAAPGIINVDFADVRTIVQDAGAAVIGVGVASGQDRAANAVNFALNSPLLETSAEGAKGVLLGVSGGRDLKMSEVNEAARIVSQMVDPGARIIFGAYHDRSLRPRHMKVTVIATGFNGGQPGSLFHNSFAERSQIGAGTVNPPAVYLGEKKKEPAGARKAYPSSQQGAAEPGVKLIDAKFTDHVKQGEKSLDKIETDKKETDIWDIDIPAFLRRKKK
jgi:cell division protein FtsZ